MDNDKNNLTVLKLENYIESIPDFPKNFNLKASVSSFVFRDFFFASFMISEILFITLILFYVYLLVYRTQRNNFYAKYKF